MVQLFLVALLLLIDSTFATCPSGFSLNQANNNCYLKLTTAQSWDSAKATCNGLGANLATVKNAAENTYVTALNGGTVYLWIGYNNKGRSDTLNYVWESGSSSTYTYWENQEPNNYGNDEHCTFMFLTGKWNDYTCSKNILGTVYLYGVCQVANPTPAPTKIPTITPTKAPTFTPTKLPTFAPTKYPTVIPSKSPTPVPTIMPTSLPSKVPTVIPTATPSYVPTSKPSSFPTSLPSAVPSLQPTSMPTGNPTSLPTCTPTSLPSSSPTSVPSSFPSSIPTETPTSEPTSQPSSVPSSQPSRIPTGEPTCAPSGRPSSAPSGVPTGAPSNQPTSVPTGVPSSVPTSEPTSNPSSHPSSEPSTFPTGEPTSFPSGVPTGAPSNQPTNEPSSEPSTFPTGEPTFFPSGVPTGAPSHQPTSVPSGEPTVSPTFLPTVLPSRIPSVLPTMKPTARPTLPDQTNPPTLQPTMSPAPVINSISVESGQSYVKVSVSLNTAGTIICMAVPPLSSVNFKSTDVFSLGKTAYVSSSLTTGIVQISGLDPNTSYDVYCGAKNSYGVTSSLKKVNATTSCCKTVGIQMNLMSIIEGEDVSNAMIVYLNHRPSAELKLRLVGERYVEVNGSLVASSINHQDQSNFFMYPNTIIFNEKNWNIGQAISFLRANVYGSYKLSAILDGLSKSEYFNQPIFVDSSKDELINAQYIVARKKSEDPVVPTLMKVQFSGDGLSLVGTFNSITNKMNLFSSFECRILFDFVGIDHASCTWLDAKSFSVILGGQGRLMIGSWFVLRGNVLQAACDDDSDEGRIKCSQRPTVSEINITISAPAVPVQPKVVIAGPHAIGPCDSPILSLLSSTGSGGRTWLSITFAVISQSSKAIELLKFLNSTYKINPPTAIPNGMLEPGYSYDIVVSLCNFLGQCGSGTHSLIVSENVAPLVSILGESSRIISVDRSLTLTAKATVSPCAGDTPVTIATKTQSLAYSWSVYYNGQSSLTLKSESRDSSIFKLSSFSLLPQSSYRFVVSVTMAGSTQIGTAAVNVMVSSSHIVSVISGSDVRSLRLGENIVLDGKNSYDSGMKLFNTSLTRSWSYSWSCIQLSPFNTSCPFRLLPIHDDANGKPTQVRLMSELWGSVGSTSQVTLTVADASRSSQASVKVILVDTQSPVVKASSSLAVSRKLNTVDSLVVYGSVQVAVPTKAEWSSNDPNIDLSKASESRYSRIINPQSVGMNLILKPNVLVGRSLPYIFTLSCGSAYVSVTVLVNTAPISGEFTVTPSEGEEMNHDFMMMTMPWSDDDLPVTYEFGYSSSSFGDSLMVVQSRSEQSFAKTKLPAGSESSSNLLSAVLRIYDALHAQTRVKFDVKVTKLVFSSTTEIQAKINDFLAEAVTSAALKQVVSVSSSVINQKNCSLSPPCEAFHRDDCSHTENTCGPCWLGYVGVSGDSNTLCIDPYSVADILNKPCNSSFDCGQDSRLVCNVSIDATKVCQWPEKECSMDCSGRGKCKRLHKISLLEVSSCSLADDSCIPICECIDGYDGHACEQSFVDFEAERSIRENLLKSLYDLSESEDVNEQEISSWVSSLGELTRANNMLNEGAISSLGLIVLSAIEGAKDLSMPLDSTTGLLDVIDSAGSGNVANRRRSRRLLLSNTIVQDESKTTNMLSTLSQYGDYLTRQMVAGSEDLSYIKENFRLVSTSMTLLDYSDAYTVTIPSTIAETFDGVVATQVVVTPTDSFISGSAEGEETMNLALFESTSVPSSLPNVISKAVSLQLAMSSGGTNSRRLSRRLNDVEFVVVLQNVNPVKYLSTPPDLNYSFTCVLGHMDNFEYECPSYSPESNDVVINKLHYACNGTVAGVKYVKCDVYQVIPSCVILNRDDVACEVTSYTEYNTTCQCSPSTPVVGVRKLSDSMNGIGYEVVAMSTIIVESTIDTFAGADELNSVGDLRKVLTVIILYAALWGTGFLGITLCSWNRHRKVMKIKHEGTNLAKKKAIASKSRTKEAVMGYLVSYINEVFPAVFRNKPSIYRLWGEISRHHRYIILFTAQGDDADFRRMLTAVQLMTIQSMLMFMLALVYDVQFPIDNGKCAQIDTESTCLDQKSPFDSSQAMCNWQYNELAGSYGCVFESPNFTIETFIILSIVVAMFTAPFNLVVDFLFNEILTAPTADAIKVRAQETALNRLGRRLSVQANRAANEIRRVSVSGVQAVGRAAMLARQSMVSIANFSKIQTAIVAPSATVDAHTLACVSATEIVEDAVESLKAFEKRRDSHVVHPLNECIAKKERREKAMKRHKKEGEQPLTRAISQNFSECSMDELVTLLMVDLVEQRRILKGHEQEIFDSKWGIDPTGEFSRRMQSYFLSFCYYQRSSKDIIVKELELVRKEAELKIKKLKLATDMDAGLELLHLFVMDLLDRNSSVAKIFAAKSGEDFRHSMVVTKSVKVIAWIMVVLLNFFFVYYSMLRGLQRGFHWQMVFAMSCVTQLIIEILVYETSECAIMHYYIPNLVIDEVQKASKVLYEAIYRMCNRDYSENLVLDAPRYLFVSSNVARKFPHLLESVIVRSYHTYFPGELGNKWKIYHAAYGNDHGLSGIRNFSITAVFLASLQYLGASPPMVQRVIIHSLQPLIVGFICIAWIFLTKRPAMAAFIAILVVWRAFYVYRNYRKRQAGGQVTPIVFDTNSKSNTIEQIDDHLSGKLNDIGKVHPEPDAFGQDLKNEVVLQAEVVDLAHVGDEDKNDGLEYDFSELVQEIFDRDRSLSIDNVEGSLHRDRLGSFDDWTSDQNDRDRFQKWIDSVFNGDD